MVVQPSLCWTWSGIPKTGFVRHRPSDKLPFFQHVDKSGTATQFLDGSNRFYTLIPHDFGMKKPPMLDTAEIIKVIYSVKARCK